MNPESSVIEADEVFTERERLKLEREAKVCRNELKNLRDAIHSLKTTHQKDVKIIRNLIEGATPASFYPENEKLEMQLHPIGYIKSLFKAKNGIPHQSNVCPISRCQLKIEKSVFTNPHHPLIGLEQFSHIWVIFIFHKNQQGDKYQRFTKAKVKPPRLDGRTMGVFATRSPHRPNPIGLTLTCLEKVEDDSLYLSGVDLLDGTPVVDIKPYIPSYDVPKSPAVNIKDHVIHKKENDMSKDESIGCPRDENGSQLMTNTASGKTGTDYILDSISQIHLPQSSDLSSELPVVSVATWIVQPVIAKLVVVFSKRAETDLKKFHKKSDHEEECPFCLEFLKCPEECSQIIQQLLQNDPRSIYRRNSCSDKLYYFSVDKLHITAWFDDNEDITEVLRVLPLENRKCNTPA